MTDQVLSVIETLIFSLRKAEEQVATEIGKHALSKDWSLVNEQTERGKQFQNMVQRVEGLKNDWLRLSGDSDLGADDLVIPVGERTTWALLGEKIRVETEGGNTTYSNIIPTNLFFSLSMSAYRFIKLNGFVKTSHVLSETRDIIGKMSDYKSDSSIRLPVYNCFKVLVREGIFTKIDSHKYTLATGRESDFFALLQKIDKGVIHAEAVRRLREAGENEMAEALDKWENGTNEVLKKNGWDGAVSGEKKGTLYQDFPDMRKIIWPYRY